MSDNHWNEDEKNKGVRDPELDGYEALFENKKLNQEKEGYCHYENEKAEAADNNPKKEEAKHSYLKDRPERPDDKDDESNKNFNSEQNENSEIVNFSERVKSLKQKDNSLKSSSNSQPAKDWATETPMGFFKEFENRFCQSPILLFHTPEGEPFMTYNTNGYNENIMIESRGFEDLCNRFSMKIDDTVALSSQFIKKIQRILSAKARFDAPTLQTHTRYARINNAIYIDLANHARQQVEITEHGWRIIENLNSPVKFVRKPGMKAMPIPQKSGNINDLKPLLKIDHDDWVLLVTWILFAMNPGGSFPILILNGQQGSAKTTTAKLLRDLIDPSTSLPQYLPSSERDLIIASHNSWLLNFDNVSGISPRLADAFCRISTGGTFRTRKLYKNDEEMLFTIKRPVIMNGITDISTRSDFLDRSIIIDMPIINKNSRLTEHELNTYWHEYKAGLFGNFCDALSVGLANYRNIKIPDLPRMADFAKFATATEPAFNWECGVFLNAYENKRKNLNEMTIEANPIASAVIRLIENTAENGWIGTATELNDDLKKYADEKTIKSKDWPKAANALSNQLKRIAPSLQEKGIMIERSKSGTRKIRITKYEIPSHEAEAWQSDNKESKNNQFIEYEEGVIK